ncbi:MAG: putative PEP-binding protein [Cyanobacteria bacterium J06635_15]
MAQFRSLHQLLPRDRVWAGDKALALNRLMAANLPILPGWVISAEQLSQFLATLKHPDPLFRDFPSSSLRLDVSNPWQLQQVAQRIQQAILQADFPLNLEPISRQIQTPAAILRPSFSVLGNMNPLLEHQVSGLLGAVVCWQQPTALQQGVQALWAKLFSAKSLLYWQRSPVALQNVRLAVMIQPLSAAIAAGVATVTSEMTEVKVVMGLGQALTRGEAVPTRYTFQGSTLQAHTAGHQTLAWQGAHSSDAGVADSSQPLATTINAVTQAQDLAYLTPTSLHTATTPTLTPDQLTMLRDALQTAAKTLGKPITVEWLFALDKATEIGTHPTQLYLTQGYLNSVGLQRQTFIPIKPEIPTVTLAQGLGVAPGSVIAPAVVLTDNNLPVIPLPLGRIVVAKSIQPDWITYLKGSAGLIAERGGFTSHAAILARELGIPAVVGVPQATDVIVTGKTILLDADRGAIYPADRAQLSKATDSKRLRHAADPRSSQFPPVPLTTQLMVTVSQIETLAQNIHRLPIDGVGLIRAELLLLPHLDGYHPQAWLTRRDHPQGTAFDHRAELTNRLSQLLIDIARKFSPRPVRYRALDLRPHEFQQLKGNPTPSTNPALDIRGTFSIQQHPDLFDLELEALAAAQQAGCTNLQLILPFVRTVEEFQFCRQRVEKARLFQASQFQLWIMAEVPSVLFLLSDYVAAGAQGIAIGSNDLIQLMLGIDRDQPAFADLFNQGHPAVMGAIAQIIRTARQAGVPTTLCGAMPSRNPRLIQDLVQWGITALSVDFQSLRETAWAIADAEQQLSSRV